MRNGFSIFEEKILPMKKRIGFWLLAVGLLFTSAIRQTSYEVKVNTAEVELVEGLYVFTDCKPVKPYESLCTVQLGGAYLGDVQYNGIRNALIKKIKTTCPTANGVIFTLTTGKKDKAEGIRFK